MSKAKDSIAAQYYQVEEYDLGGDVYFPNDVIIEEKRFSALTVIQLLTAWIVVFFGIVSGAAIGPVFKYMEQHGISACLACSWRCQCMCVFLVPAALAERYFGGKRIDWLDVKPGLRFPVWVYLLIAGVAWASNLLLWIIGLQFTTTVRASILESSHPLVLVMYLQWVVSERITILEWIGVFVAFSGIIIATSTDLSPGVGNSLSTTSTLFGDSLCFLAAVSEAVVILNRSQVKVFVPLFQYTAVTTVMVTLFASLSAVLLEGSEVFCLQSNCLAGWLSKDWILAMLVFGFVVGVFCTTGFNYSIQYLSPLVFSSVTLVDPAVTGVISWAAGIEGIPDWLTISGGLVVVLGVLFITVGEQRREVRHRNSSNSLNSDKNSCHSCLDNRSSRGASVSSEESNDEEMNVL